MIEQSTKSSFFSKQFSETEKKLKSDLFWIIFDVKVEIQLEAHLTDCVHLYNCFFCFFCFFAFFPLLIILCFEIYCKACFHTILITLKATGIKSVILLNIPNLKTNFNIVLQIKQILICTKTIKILKFLQRQTKTHLQILFQSIIYVNIVVAFNNDFALY